MPTFQPGQWPDLEGRLVPGMGATDAAWKRLGDAHAQLWRRYIPPIGASPRTRALTTTPATLGRVWLRAGDTPTEVELICALSRTSGTGAARLFLNGSTHIAGLSGPTQGWVQGHKAITAPGEVLIQGDTTSGGWLSWGWALRYRQTLDSTVSPGDYVTTDATHATADVPVTSERVGRLIRGPSDIARLRPVTIWSMHVGPLSTRPAPVIAASQRMRRYYVDGYAVGAGTQIVTISGKTLAFTGGELLGGDETLGGDDGGVWTHHEIQLGPGRHQLVASGAAVLTDLQIVRG